MESKKHVCPSAPLYEGSRLLGIVNENNEVSILTEPMEIDDVFIASASKGKLPEQKFRFTNKCVKSGCKQWTGEQCGVIKRVLENIEQSTIKNELPECNIRSECRWFDQEGISACKVCTSIKYINYIS
ncbi:hypothetical protein [Niastella yeongjuensis]|nr:hypothetical protein [Niastella yeongjuensis]